MSQAFFELIIVWVTVNFRGGYFYACPFFSNFLHKLLFLHLVSRSQDQFKFLHAYQMADI